MRLTNTGAVALIVALTAVLSNPAAAEFPQSATYVGTMKARGKVTIPGFPKQKLKDSSPDTLMDLRGDLGTYTFHPSGNTLTGPMAAGKKPGRFDVVQPTGQALDELISGTQTYLTDTAGIGVTVSDVQVSGTHVMKKDGARSGSRGKPTSTRNTMELMQQLDTESHDGATWRTPAQLGRHSREAAPSHMWSLGRQNDRNMGTQ